MKNKFYSLTDTGKRVKNFNPKKLKPYKYDDPDMPDAIVMGYKYDDKEVCYLTCDMYGKLHYVESLATHPEFRGFGIATRLMRWMIRFSKHRKRDVALSASHMAMNMYLKLGFVLRWPGETERDLIYKVP